MARRAVGLLVVLGLLGVACGSDGSSGSSESEQRAEQSAAVEVAPLVAPLSFLVWGWQVNDLCEDNLPAAEAANASVEAAATADEALAALVESSALFADEVARIEEIRRPSGNTEQVEEYLDLRRSAADLFATAEDAATLDEFLARSETLETAFGNVDAAARDLGLDQCTADAGTAGADETDEGADDEPTVREASLEELESQGFTAEEAECMVDAVLGSADGYPTQEAVEDAVARCLAPGRLEEIYG